MTKGLVTIFGGSGFIGRYAARELVKKGWRVRVACRRVNLAGDVRLAGAPGWVDIAQANIRDRASVERALEGADAVVNLVGVLVEKGKQTFESTQAEGAALLAEVAAEKGITRFVQVSAIGADAESKSDYAKTKAEAEAAVRGAVPLEAVKGSMAMLLTLEVESVDALTQLALELGADDTGGDEVLATLLTGDPTPPVMRLGRTFSIDGDVAERLASVPGLAKVQLTARRGKANLRLVA